MSTISQTLWLRSQAAQHNLQTMTSYSAAFFGTAALQTLALGLSAPRSFWAAMARAVAAGDIPANPPLNAPPPAVVVLAPGPEATPPAPEATPPAQTADTGPSPYLLDAPRNGLPDDLTTLAGIGPRLASALNEFGIYHFDQIATLDEFGIAWLDAQQKGFRMICGRYDLIEQARARL